MLPPDDATPPAAPAPDRIDLGLAGVVHDANQMLAVVAGRAELLLRRAPEHREHLEAILLAATDAATMLRRLGVAAGAAGPAPGAARAGGPRAAPPPACDVARAVDEAALLVIPPDGAWRPAGEPAADGAWRLERRVEAGLVAALPPPLLREVLVNLLNNALAVLPRGGRISIGAVRDGGNCRLSVADSGPGLPTADPEAVFAVGFTTSGRPGKGLGLAACRQLLAGHAASLHAARDGGPGAVFSLVAPLGATEAIAVPGPVAAPTSGGLPIGLPVLVVDDEPAVREMLGDLLGELGCTVTCHRDGESALEAGAPGGAVLALVDRRLPGMGGEALAARLRERAPGLVIAVMTGWDRDQDLPAAGGADFLLRKPLAPAALQEVLARADLVWRERRTGGSAPGGA